MDGTPSSYVTFGGHHSRQLAQLMDMHVQPEGAGTDLHSCLFRDLDIECPECKDSSATARQCTRVGSHRCQT